MRLIDYTANEIPYLTGVNIKQSDGSFKTFEQVFGEIWALWDELPGVIKHMIAKVVFGGADIDTAQRMCSIAANVGLTIEEAICNNFEVPCDISKLI